MCAAQTQVMATLTPTIPVKDPKLGHGGSGAHPPVSDGGDDAAGQRFSGLRTAAASSPPGPAGHPGSDHDAVRFLHQRVCFSPGTAHARRKWHLCPRLAPGSLPVTLLLVNTLLLLVSSHGGTRPTPDHSPGRLGSRAIDSGSFHWSGTNFPWLGSTVVLGFAFPAGQWMAWRELADRGFYIVTSASSSFVYLLTAAHAVHLAGGLLVLLYAGATSLLPSLSRPVASWWTSPPGTGTSWLCCGFISSPYWSSCGSLTVVS